MSPTASPSPSRTSAWAERVDALLVVAAVAVGGLVLWLLWRAEQKRKAALQAYAATQGWTYTGRDDSQTERDGRPFGTGSSRRAENVLSGSLDGAPFTAFDYRYSTESGSGKNRRRQTHRYSVLCLALRAPLPRLEITQENVLHKIGGALGFDDIELESDDFNRRFRVTGEDRKLAYDVLHARTMEALLGRSDVAMRFQGAEVVCWRGGRMEPESLSSWAATPRLVVDAVPEFVWADRGA